MADGLAADPTSVATSPRPARRPGEAARSATTARAPLLLLLCATLGCGSSTALGELRLAEFSISGCGAALPAVTGCDLRKTPLALGARVSAAARLRQDGVPLGLRSGNEAVLALEAEGDGVALIGKGAGAADLWATRSGADVDRLPILVVPIARFAYSRLSDSSGTFTPRSEGDADGEFAVVKGQQRIGLVMGMQGIGDLQLAGRDSATWTTGPGLSLAMGAGSPSALYFVFDRPPPGRYPFELRARAGGAQARLLIVVSE